MTEMQSLVCVQCGSKAEELYHQFVGSAIKIAHCVTCEGVVDKYIEYDPVLIVLDAVLQKPQAYRHLLINSTFQSHIRLALILMLCDTYLHWGALQTSPYQDSPVEEHIFYAALEWDFYKMFIVTVAEWFFLGLSLAVLIHLFGHISKNKNVVPSRCDILKSWTVSNFGKLFVIPAILWGQSHSTIYLSLSALFVYASNVQAMKVFCRLTRSVAVVLVGIAWIMKSFMSSFIHSALTGA